MIPKLNVQSTCPGILWKLELEAFLECGGWNLDVHSFTHGSPYNVKPPTLSTFTSITCARWRSAPSNSAILLQRVRPIIRAELRLLGPSTRTCNCCPISLR